MAELECHSQCTASDIFFLLSSFAPEWLYLLESFIEDKKGREASKYNLRWMGHHVPLCVPADLPRQCCLVAGGGCRNWKRFHKHSAALLVCLYRCVCGWVVGGWVGVWVGGWVCGCGWVCAHVCVSVAAFTPFHIP